MNDSINDATKTIQRLNDFHRQNPYNTTLGQFVITRAVSFLSLGDLNRCLRAMIKFDNFNEDNDPYGEHDCASFNVTFADGSTNKMLFKIDYYDKNLEFGSDDPAKISKTQRVLTLMFASDY